METPSLIHKIIRQHAMQNLQKRNIKMVYFYLISNVAMLGWWQCLDAGNVEMVAMLELFGGNVGMVAMLEHNPIITDTPSYASSYVTDVVPPIVTLLLNICLITGLCYIRHHHSLLARSSSTISNRSGPRVQWKAPVLVGAAAISYQILSSTTLISQIIDYLPDVPEAKLMKNSLKPKLGVWKQPLPQSKSTSFSLESTKEDNRQQIANMEETIEQRNLQIR
uniref:Uncharacterized protein n=1 Tax=Romanomermis culicivorax TaxID=13658 RepID=A0A915KYQ9_ROMCU